MLTKGLSVNSDSEQATLSKPHHDDSTLNQTEEVNSTEIIIPLMCYCVSLIGYSELILQAVYCIT